MPDHQKGQAKLAVQPLQQVQNGPRGFRVQGQGCLIGQQKNRIDRQDPRDADTLPLSCGYIMDWFTRKVLAWRISNTLEAKFCVEALNEAIHKFGAPEIMNTDQGSQFTSFDWTDRLKRAKTKISMDGKARYLDNIFIERLWRSLKYECVYLHAWETGSQARAGVGRWITFYNQQRPHAAHGGQPPAVVYFNATQTDQQVQAVA